MNRADVASGLILGSLGVYAAVQSYAFGLGTLPQPGAGFFPFIAGVLMTLCSGAVLLRALILGRVPPRGHEPRDSTNWRKVWLCLAALVAYAVALPLIGFIASTFLVMFALSRLDPQTSWMGSFLIAALGSVGFWVMFVQLLSVRFPPPSIGF